MADLDNVVENTLNRSVSTVESLASTNSPRFELNKISIKKQFYIEDTGHFKCCDDNSIIISFIDRVKLVVDEHSIDALLSGELSRCFCSIFLPDNSQHEICLGEPRDRQDDYFKKYLNFFDQWLDWLIKDGTIERKKHYQSRINIT